MNQLACTLTTDLAHTRVCVCVRTGENIVPKAAKEHPRALDSHTRGFSAAPESHTHTLREREPRSSLAEARAACAW